MSIREVIAKARDAQDKHDRVHGGQLSLQSGAKDRTPWPQELMHAEDCAWRFGASASCDCGLSERLP